MLIVFFVFQTDFVDELRIGPELLPQRDRPRPRIRFWDPPRHLDFKMPKVRAPNPLTLFWPSR